MLVIIIIRLFNIIVYNLNETEILNSDFKKNFPGISDFTVGILFSILYMDQTKF